jgi:hypothetical protein
MPESNWHRLKIPSAVVPPPAPALPLLNRVHRFLRATIMRRPALISLLPLLAGAAWASPSRPNVLFILSDDLRPDLSCYGSYVETPNLDRLAGRGVRFANAWVQYPLCNPSRTSMLTGRHPRPRAPSPIGITSA